MALTIGAPTLRDPPKGTPDVIGIWRLDSLIQNGTNCPPALLDTYGRENEFTKDGKWHVRSRPGDVDDRPQIFSVGVTGTSPALFDTIPRKGELAVEAMRGIVRVEGDTLTICWVRWDHPRPTTFESVTGSNAWLAVYKRAKKGN